jgi:ankyrin repeat protein
MIYTLIIGVWEIFPKLSQKFSAIQSAIVQRNNHRFPERTLMLLRRIASFMFVIVALAGICPIAFDAKIALAAGEEDLSVNARLLVYVKNGDVPNVERSLKEGASVDSRNRIGESALVIALKKNDLKIAQLMLDAGTDVNLAAVSGVTPLMAAAYGGQTHMAAQLLAKGADVNAVDRLKKNAMTYAAGEGHAEVVKLLLGHGVNPNAIYENDLTALMWAAGGGNVEAVKVLLDAGAQTALKDNRGKTAADIAHELQHDDIVRLIEAPRAAKSAAAGG